MIIPLQNRLRKRLHAEIAMLQDELVEVLYGLDGSLVLHGGTAVWRCYGGNRFSEDLDFYCGKPGRIAEGLGAAVSARGLTLGKMKRTENLIFCKISGGSAEVRVEMNFSKAVKPAVGRYEKADGTYMDVLTLTPAGLIMEKMGAYEGRRFIRDIYDIYHLSDQVQDDREVRKRMAEFLAGIREPADERNLKALVYSGAVPSFSQMVGALRGRFG